MLSFSDPLDDDNQPLFIKKNFNVFFRDILFMYICIIA